MKIMVTGGAGFIGSALIRELLTTTNHRVLNFDFLTYAGNLESLKSVSNSPNYSFIKGDICSEGDVKQAFKAFEPDILMHLAAESHVDRSIDSPAPFVKTNIFGTYNLLEISRHYSKNHPDFRFHHISTDEVYGDLSLNDEKFCEASPYNPHSPYSASKASSDHLVRAYHRTYGLNAVITNCSNNFGPFQFPEKLIPLTILNALEGLPLPVYGKGEQIRDWLYVEDHARALIRVALNGKTGETYNIGGANEKTNIEVVQSICAILNEISPRKGGKKYESLITFVADRPGHDLRYAINADKIERELGFKRQETFSSGLKKTVEWYLNNEWWHKPLYNRYKRERLGLSSQRG